MKKNRRNSNIAEVEKTKEKALIPEKNIFIDGLEVNKKDFEFVVKIECSNNPLNKFLKINIICFRKDDENSSGKCVLSSYQTPPSPLKELELHKMSFNVIDLCFSEKNMESVVMTTIEREIAQKCFIEYKEEVLIRIGDILIKKPILSLMYKTTKKKISLEEVELYEEPWIPKYLRCQKSFYPNVC